MTKQYRHGDLLIVAEEALPKNAKPSKELVLAYGEVTGHAHRLSKGAQTYSVGGATWFRAVPGTQLTHEEHGPIAFEPGVYRVIRQREYTPERDIMVAD